MKKMDLVHIEPAATARIVAIVMILPIFILGVLFYVQSTLSGQDYTLDMILLTYELETKGDVTEYLSVIGILAIASMLKGIFLYIFTFIFAHFYNLLAKRIGGITVYMSDKR